MPRNKAYDVTGEPTAAKMEQIDEMLRALFEDVVGLEIVHNVLSDTHGDAEEGTLVEGDVLYVNDDDKLDRLTIGAADRVLRSNGTAPSWAQVVLTTDVTGTLPVANGGTGLASYAIGDLIYASAATTLAKLAGVATGNALISGGVNTAPSWGKIGLTTHVSGTLGVGSGGTGRATSTNGGLLVGTGATSAYDILSPSTLGCWLQANGASSQPSWSNWTLPTTLAAGDLLYASSTSAISRLAKGTGLQFLRMNSGATAPEWATFGPMEAGGRLTLTSGTPLTTSDVTAAGTLYYTPYVSSQIVLFDGTTWGLYTFTERSLSLTLTSGKNYDVFLYNNAGTLTLELSTAWTNDTTRADALALQDGVYVKSGSTTRRWLGTIRASGSNTTEDSKTKRFVWNKYNQVRREWRRIETTDSWSYGTATFRQANASTSNQVECVVGEPSHYYLFLMANVSATVAGSGLVVNIGEDSTTTPKSETITVLGNTSAAGEFKQAMALQNSFVPLGYHYYTWLEWGNPAGAGTITWYGDNGTPTLLQSGLSGFVNA